MTTHIVYVTHSSKKNASSIVDKLLSKKLIACATIFSVDSYYIWKDKRQIGKEWVTLLKTNKPKVVERAVLKIHPYDVPCILSWKVKANTSYDAWVKSSCK